MKQLNHISSLIILLASLTACDHSDMPIQHADDYDYITFSVETGKMLTRTNAYEAYDPARHPATMGVFGYYDLADYSALTRAADDEEPMVGITLKPNPVFNNGTVTYNAATTTWSTAVSKPWNDYKGATTFDFFAYMPQTEGATLGRTATGTYSLSVPFAMPDGAPFLTDTKAAPIICAMPDHKAGTTSDGSQFTFDRTVKFKFDQTLVGYKLLFMLDARMNNLRQFRIKRVALSGTIATGGTVSRTYTWDDEDGWSAQNIQWTLNRQTVTNAPVAYVDSDDQAYDNQAQTLLATAAGYKQWGSTLYFVPDAQFQPTITVTYDVELLAEDGTTVITRKDVTSDIVLNKSNFSTLASGQMAMINPVRILIQPRYLYVLADDDAYTGHLLIE